MSHPGNKKSILFIIDGLEFGGGERVFLQLASGLRNRYRIAVATNASGKFAQELTNLEIKTFSVDMSRQLAFKAILQLRDIIREDKVNLVHSQGARADFFARLAGKIADSPHILCTMAMPVEGFNVGPVRKKVYCLLDQFSAQYVERFIVVSDSLKSFLTEVRGIPPQKVVRIYNGIEVNRYQPNTREITLRNKWGISVSTKLIGAIGRMVWQKGFEFLIRAMTNITAAFPETRLLFVGDGPLRSKLEALAKKLNIDDKIIFTGFRSDVIRILSVIDILAVPSVLEGFPMITLEGMAMAKPIVATCIQGITEQISHNHEGILVKPKDAVALANGIQQLLLDEKLALKLGKSAREKVEKQFSIDKTIEKTEEVYSSLLK